MLAVRAENSDLIERCDRKKKRRTKYTFVGRKGSRGVGRATYLALNRVVPILNIFAASDSVSRATSASDFLFIGCGEEVGDWRRQ